MRTPLAVLKIHLEALEDGIQDEEESYPILQQKISQIDRLIEDIYMLSKSDINQLKSGGRREDDPLRSKFGRSSYLPGRGFDNED